jgi:flagellar biosynthetic protein FlhB
MTEEQPGAEKEHEPTQKRLDDARRRGEGPQSTDITVAASYGGFLVACLLVGEGSLKELTVIGTTLIEDSDRLSAQISTGATAPMAEILLATVLAVAPFFAFPAIGAALSLGLQRAFVIAPEKVMPRWSRLSPLAGLSRKFGMDGLFEFAKSAVKMAIIGVILGYFLLSRADDIGASMYLAPQAAIMLLLQLTMAFLLLILIESIVIGGLDLMWQRRSFLRRNRMSRQDVLDELRQSEGDPHVRQSRQSRAKEIATNRMLLDVPKSNVVIVNPSHYAVALVWKRGEHAAPVCVAKGVDEVAARIRASADQAGVPIHRDPPTARSIHAMVDIGQQIRPEQYRAVAAAIRFAETMRAKGKRR